MVLFSFHYLITSLSLGIWIGRPWNILIVPCLFYLVQLFLWLTGITPDTPSDVFWGYQLIVTFEGLLISIKFLHLQRFYSFLSFKIGYERVWIKFLVSIAALIGAQVFYGTLPPTKDNPYGIFFTALTSVLIIFITWYSLLYESEVFERDHKEYSFFFFVWWAILLVSAQLMFYIVFTGLDEIWVAMIAGSAPLLILFLLSCFICC